MLSFAPMIIMLVLVLVMYFLVVRPQQKREQRRGLMLSSLKPGNVVYAGGGIHGTVLEVKQDVFTMSTAPAKTHLELDVNVLEEIEGFDLKLEKDHQKYLREQRMRKKNGGGESRPDPYGLRTPKGPHL